MTLIQHGADLDAAEAHAIAVAAEGGGTYVSAYNDTGVIAGQSTIGRELEAELGAPLTVAAPLGGGSLASGLGLWRAGREAIRVVAIEAARSPAFATALAAGEITPFTVGDTLADGLAGNLEPGSATFPLVRDHVAALAQVSEAEIEEAIRFLARAHGIVSEGAGAVGRRRRHDRPRPARPRAAGDPRHRPQHRPADAGRHPVPCLIALFALIGPRVALVVTWLTSNMISRAIDSLGGRRRSASCSCRGRRSPTSCSTTSAPAARSSASSGSSSGSPSSLDIGGYVGGRRWRATRPRRRAARGRRAAGGAGSAYSGGAMRR